MTRTKATVSLFVFCALLVPLLLAPGPLAAKTHATKSRAKPVAAKSTKTVKTAKPATKVAKPAVVMPLPDRNPNRAAMKAAASPPGASADATAAIAARPLPHEVPEASAAETEANASGIPVPDRNPERPASKSLVAAPDPAVLAPVPVVNAPAPKPAPSGAYAAILKPLLDYQLSNSDAANLKDAFSASFRGDDAGSHEAVSRNQGQRRAQACRLVRIPEWRLRRLRRSDRGLPPRQSGLAWPRGAARAGGDRPLSCRCEPGKGAGLLRQLNAVDRRRQGRSRRSLHEGKQRARGARARGLGLARLSAQSRGGEKDPRPLRLNADRGGPPGSHRQAALSGQQGDRRGRASHLEAASRRRAEEGCGAHCRGQARGKCRQAARCAAGERDRRRHRPPLQPHSMAKAQRPRPGSLEDAARCAARAGQADRPRRLVERAAPQLPHRAQLRTTSHCL